MLRRVRPNPGEQILAFDVAEKLRNRVGRPQGGWDFPQRFYAPISPQLGFSQLCRGGRNKASSVAAGTKRIRFPLLGVRWQQITP